MGETNIIQMANFQFPKIKLNQPLWVLIIVFSFLGISEYYNLKWLFVLSLIGSVWAILLLIITMTLYSIKYAKK